VNLISKSEIYLRTWYHVAIVYSGSDVRMYINGNLEASAPGTVCSNSGDLWIAGAASDGWLGCMLYPFNGKLDELRIYRRELSAQEVMGFYYRDCDPGGLPWWWKNYFFGRSDVSAEQMSPRGDMTNLQAFQLLKTPLDFYDGLVPSLSIVDGNGQNGVPECFLAQSLVVLVSGNGNVEANAPVTFTVIQGAGQLSASMNPSGTALSSTTSLTVRSDVNGHATVYFKPSIFGTGECMIGAGTGSAEPVVFSATRNPFVGCWNFDEKGGVIAHDSSHTGNDATLYNGISWGIGFDGGGGLQFNGDQCMVIPNPDNRVIPSTGHPFSLSFWLIQYAATQGSMSALISNEIYLTSGFRCGIDRGLYNTTGSGINRLKFWSGESGGNIDIDTPDEILTGQWYHVAITYSGTLARIYLNGKLESTGSGTILSNHNALVVGNGIGGYLAWDGGIEALHIYQKELSPAEVGGIYNRESNNDGLPDWWKEKYFYTLNVDPCAMASCGKGLTNLQAFQQDVNPVDYYDGHVPSVSLVSGNSQSGDAGATLENPLVVEITDAAGNPLVNAPVIFFVTGGDGGLSLPGQSGGGKKFSTRTDAGGLASVLFTLSETAGGISQIAAAAGVNTAARVGFTETTNPATSGGTGGTPSGNQSSIQNVSTSLNSDGSIDVTWGNSSSGTDSITIKTRKSDGTWDVVGTVPAGTTSYHIPPPQ
jgi:hypothetical protein